MSDGPRISSSFVKDKIIEVEDMVANEKVAQPEVNDQQNEVVVVSPPQYTGRRLHILSTAFSVATFMVALDRTILGELQKAFESQMLIRFTQQLLPYRELPLNSILSLISAGMGVLTY